MYSTQSKNIVRPSRASGDAIATPRPRARDRRVVVLPESGGPSYTTRTTKTPRSLSTIGMGTAVHRRRTAGVAGNRNDRRVQSGRDQLKAWACFDTAARTIAKLLC